MIGMNFVQVNIIHYIQFFFDISIKFPDRDKTSNGLDSDNIENVI